jgi:hypothetical protein
MLVGARRSLERGSCDNLVCSRHASLPMSQDPSALAVLPLSQIFYKFKSTRRANTEIRVPDKPSEANPYWLRQRGLAGRPDSEARRSLARSRQALGRLQFL